MPRRTKAEIDIDREKASPQKAAPAAAKARRAPKSTPTRARKAAVKPAVTVTQGQVALTGMEPPKPPKPEGTVRGKLCEALRGGCTRRAACGYAGIDEATLNELIETDPAFRAAVARAEDESEKSFVEVIQRAAQEGNWKAAAWWLERRRKDEYSARREVKHGGGIGVARTATDFDDDELATIAAGSGLRALTPP